MYLLDTDVCIQFMKKDEAVVNMVRAIKEINISVVTLAELFYGVYSSKNREKHMKSLGDFLSGVDILNAELPVAVNFGTIKSELRAKGKLAGDFDIMNGAFARAYGLTLITRNIRHYKPIRGIRIEPV